MTSFAFAAWLAMGLAQQAETVLTVERELAIASETVTTPSGNAIGELAALLLHTSGPH